MMTNPTALKFGYPQSLVAETASWLVLVRPSQPTFGALVLVCREPAEAFSDLSPAAFADLGEAVRRVEGVLRAAVEYQRINYLMLMMVDRDVHFHVLPRYDGARSFEGAAFPDEGWPGPPKLSPAVELAAPALTSLTARLRALWADA
jgi:diadenosine tetraphosphate (Ap4A) HIT family hydrolase